MNNMPPAIPNFDGLDHFLDQEAASPASYLAQSATPNRQVRWEALGAFNLNEATSLWPLLTDFEDQVAPYLESGHYMGFLEEVSSSAEEGIAASSAADQGQIPNNAIYAALVPILP